MVCSMGRTPRMRAVTSLMRVHQLVLNSTSSCGPWVSLRAL